MHDRADASLPRPKSMARTFVATGVAAVALGTSGATAADADARGKSRLDPTEKRVIREVNRMRARNGLAAYSPSHALSRSADFHSRDMLRGNFFAHVSSNGISFEGRVRRYTRAARIGENLAWVPGGRRISARQVVAMWMGSPTHRAAMLAPDFARMGVARRTGVIGRTKVTVVTADLATRR